MKKIPMVRKKYIYSVNEWYNSNNMAYRRTIIFFLLCFSGMACSSSDGNMQVYSARPGELEEGDIAVLEILGEDFTPVVSRHVGCGAKSFLIDDSFEVYLDNKDDDFKIALKNVKWINYKTIKAEISSDLSEQISPGQYGITVVSPLGTLADKKNIIRIKARIDVDDQLEDTDTEDTDTEDTDTEDTDTEDTDTEDTDTEDTDTEDTDTEDTDTEDTDTEDTDTEDTDTEDTDTEDTDTDTQIIIPECQLPNSKCLDELTVSYCTNLGTWGPVETCLYYCDEEFTQDCSGECLPGESICTDDKMYAICGDDYWWNSGVGCYGHCLDGICVSYSGKHQYATKVSNATVEGRLEESFWNVNEPIEKLVFGYTDNTAFFDVVWNDQYLYVGALVYDQNMHNDSPEPWENDSIEIYIDGNNSKSPFYDSYDDRIIFTYGSSDVWVASGNTTGILFHMIHWGTYYTFESAIPWQNLGLIPYSGMTIGFDIRVNDDDDGIWAEGALIWNGDETASHDTSVFGNITLFDASLYPQEPTNNTCTSPWIIDSQMNADVLISWDNYANTLNSGNSTNCSIRDSDVFLRIEQEPWQTVDIAYSGGFSDILIREVTVSSFCSNITCLQTSDSEGHISLIGSFEQDNRYVVISAHPSSGAVSMINFTRR